MGVSVGEWAAAMTDPANTKYGRVHQRRTYKKSRGRPLPLWLCVRVGFALLCAGVSLPITFMWVRMLLTIPCAPARRQVSALLSTVSSNCTLTPDGRLNGL